MNLKALMTGMQMGMPQDAPTQSAQATAKAPHKASSVKPSTGNPVSHLAAAHKAAKAGDHAGAKKHALKAVNVLHKHFAAPDPAADAVADAAAPGGAAC